jgi:hypothetical protein
MATLLVLSLFLLTAGLTAVAARSAPLFPESRRSPILEAVVLAFVLLVIAAAILAPAAKALQSPNLYYLKDLLHLDDSYARYHWCLCRLPLALQGLLGLVFVCGLGLATGLLFTAGQPRRRWLIAAGAILAWVGLYGLLPFHLSASDFDDVFVLDKLLCSVLPYWHNNKPFFTLFDSLYRVSDIGFPADRFLRFRVNGWLVVLYELNLLVLLRRFLAQRAREAFGPGWAALGAALAMGNLGLLLLSHTLAYELAGSVCVLTACNLIEHLRSAGRRPLLSTLAILFACGAGELLQIFSYPQYDAVWMVVCVHGALALPALGARKLQRASAWALAAASAALFLTTEQEAILTSLQPHRWSSGAVAAVAGLAAASAAAAAWLIRSGACAGRRRERPSWSIPRLMLPLYAATTLALTLIPNQGHFVPETFWVFAENHARYTSLSYPFIVLALGWLACRLRQALRSRLVPGLLAALVFLAWNVPYLRGFYLSKPRPMDDDAAGAYGRNLRPILALDAALQGLPDLPLLYLPIPRDHGDHYLARAARPAAEVISVCGRGWRPGGPGRLVLSRNTLSVRRESGAVPPLRSYRGLADKGWEIQLFDDRGIDPAAVPAWCKTVASSWRSQGSFFPAPEELDSTSDSR